MNNTMNNTKYLFDIFTNEKERLGDEMTLFYNKNRESLQYKDDTGVLTVLFDKENAAEDFHYKQKDEAGIGERVLSLQNSGKDVIEENSQNVPLSFQYILDDYQTNREQIGISENKNIKKGKDEYER